MKKRADNRIKITAEHVDYVRWCVARMRLHNTSYLEFDDFVSIGVEAVLKCASRFNPALGIKFTTFIHHRVRGAILDTLRESHPGGLRIPNPRAHRDRP